MRSLLNFCFVFLCVGAIASPAVTITPGSSGMPYLGASIRIVSPRPDEVLTDDSVSVTVDLSRFDVAVPTPGDVDKGLAYSKSDPANMLTPFGQHVHVIVDNEPYMACYMKGMPFAIPKRLAPGMHTLRVFPSRSWHESVKQAGCFAMETFYVKSKSGDPVDWKKPFLTYSRPKGEYSGAGAKQIMVDFYVSNCELGKGKYTAKIEVDGTTQATADAWQPYLITGLEPGQHKVKVTLVAPDGKPVEGAWNSTERTITVK
jgi:hypothetical protein